MPNFEAAPASEVTGAAALAGGQLANHVNAG